MNRLLGQLSRTIEDHHNRTERRISALNNREPSPVTRHVSPVPPEGRPVPATPSPHQPRELAEWDPVRTSGREQAAPTLSVLQPQEERRPEAPAVPVAAAAAGAAALAEQGRVVEGWRPQLPPRAVPAAEAEASAPAPQAGPVTPVTNRYPAEGQGLWAQSPVQVLCFACPSSGALFRRRPTHRVQLTTLHTSSDSLT